MVYGIQKGMRFYRGRNYESQVYGSTGLREGFVFRGLASIHPSIHPMLFLKDSVEDCGFHCALLWLPFLIFGGLFHVCTLLAAVNVGSE